MSVGKYVRGVTSQLRLGECEACSSPPGLLSRALTLTVHSDLLTLFTVRQINCCYCCCSTDYRTHKAILPRLQSVERHATGKESRRSESRAWSR